MTTANTAKPFAFTGKGKAARTTAMAQIALLAFNEDTSRNASLANMRVTLGLPANASPEQVAAVNPELVKQARAEYLAGLIAARLPASECLKGKTSQADRLELARDIIHRMGVPATEGCRPLRKHLTKGRRSPVQQRIMRNAESTATLFFADLGASKAEGLKVKNKKAAAKRNPAPASGMGKAGNAAPSAPSAPSHSQLVKPAKPETADDVVAFLGQQSRMLQDYVNRHAKVCPTDASGAVAAFRSAIIAAANALQERKAIAANANKQADAEPAKPAKRKLVAVK